MSTGFSAEPLSDRQIADHARALRRHHGLANVDVPDVVALLSHPTILTRFGVKEFGHQIVDDEVLGGDEAVTLVTAKTVRIRLARSTHRRAIDQDRRARMTIAHEFMHGVLHRIEAPMARSRSERRKTFMPAFVSVERQASVGASAYLVTEAMVDRSRSASDLAEIARVSREAAEIRWEQACVQRGRQDVRRGLENLGDELRASQRREPERPKAAICPHCGQATLLSIGVKYLCIGACDRALDLYADGDDPSQNA